MAPRPGHASLRRVLEHCCPHRTALLPPLHGAPTAAPIAAPIAAAASASTSTSTSASTSSSGAASQPLQRRRPPVAAGLAPSGVGAVRGFMHRAGGQRAGWAAKTAAEASLDVIVDAVTRPKARKDGGIDDPTLEVADPAWADSEEDLALDLARRPRPEAMASWVAAAEGVDPFKVVANDMRTLSQGIKSLLGSDHPVLEACAKYLFELDGGKKIRPTMVLLIARAAAADEAARRRGGGAAGPGAVNGHHHHQQHEQQPRPSASNADSVGPLPLPSQRRLAEITEMIHTASLFHDDVIDEADERRGVPSINKLYGNKMAILAGDFLLARASVSLARLRNVEVVELLSTVIEHLVKGEVMQSRPQAKLLLGAASGAEGAEAALRYYLHKNYYKTGSLMANSCRAAVLLAGHAPRLQEQAFAYGRHVGLAFQLVDDVLDFEQSSETLGKPALNDLRNGLATAPVLLAARAYPAEVAALMGRKFRGDGDVERALELVQASGGLQQAKDLALVQAEMAMEAVRGLAPSPARDGLVRLASLVVNRTK